MRFRLALALVTLGPLMAVGTASAQPDQALEPPPPDQTEGSEPETDAAGDENWGAGEDQAAAPDQEEPQRLGDEQVLTEERLGVEEARSGSDPWEDPQQGYWFFGAFYRESMVPAFIIELFVDKSPSAFNPQVGAEVTYRKDGFDIIGSLYWARYNAYGPFRASGDPDTETEMIDSNLWAVMAGVDFMWSTAFNDIVALEYGVGLGFGIVGGDLIRHEAYPEGNDPRHGAWHECVSPPDYNDNLVMTPGAPANPSESAGVPLDPGYCDGPPVPDGMRGGHYNVKARRWSNGGSVPNVWFRAALPHMALRIKPVHQLMMRIDFGFDLFSGFFVGAAASYGF